MFDLNTFLSKHSKFLSKYHIGQLFTDPLVSWEDLIFVIVFRGKRIPEQSAYPLRDYRH